MKSMIKKPKISVIIPTFNRENLILDAVNSVFSQSYKNYELIIVDDGSKDNTRLILNDFIDDGRIKYIYQDNKGPAGAFNTGIKNSQGEYIAIHASDDLWLPIYLETLVTAIEKFDDSIGMIYSDSFRFDSDLKVISGKSNFTEPVIEKNSVRDFAFRQKHIYHGSALIRRKTFDKVGLFDDFMRRSEDKEFNYRFSKYYKILKFNYPLAIIRLHGKNNPRDPMDYISYKEQIEKYDCYLLNKILNDKEVADKFWFFQRRISSRFNYLWGKAYYVRGNFELAGPFLLKSILFFPFNFRAIIFFILNFFKIVDKEEVDRINRIESSVSKAKDKINK